MCSSPRLASLLPLPPLPPLLHNNYKSQNSGLMLPTYIPSFSGISSLKFLISLSSIWTVSLEIIIHEIYSWMNLSCWLMLYESHQQKTWNINTKINNWVPFKVESHYPSLSHAILGYVLLLPAYCPEISPDPTCPLQAQMWGKTAGAGRISYRMWKQSLGYIFNSHVNSYPTHILMTHNWALTQVACS